MKTSEFIKEVEALGFKVDDNRCFLNVLTAHDNGVLLSIRKDEVLGLNTRQYAFYKMRVVEKEHLFSLAVEYASTPVEEREPEKKYYIRLKDKISLDRRYINFNVISSTFNFNNALEGEGYKTQFTKQEIKDFGLQKFADSELFELVKVEE